MGGGYISGDSEPLSDENYNELQSSSTSRLPASTPPRNSGNPTSRWLDSTSIGRHPATTAPRSAENSRQVLQCSRIDCGRHWAYRPGYPNDFCCSGCRKNRAHTCRCNAMRLFEHLPDNSSSGNTEPPEPSVAPADSLRRRTCMRASCSRIWEQRSGRNSSNFCCSGCRKNRAHTIRCIGQSGGFIFE